ncbi:hypothetical protein P691DRAFT_759000 [Macrolepiota fuliginosa MF-IS2]|uniref:Nephrocystin 3-like N-terminal domain-containing protein n=1 Tax=Macrolepiota fuliginosa MF-IS2 TaxID=1400762 RepID=A0A9P5XGT9_9AGAR|nr:hypothetical protein P691DRAFT_759000 [Macrolepiota fuliginosa MF-IS2]
MPWGSQRVDDVFLVISYDRIPYTSEHSKPRYQQSFIQPKPDIPGQKSTIVLYPFSSKLTSVGLKILLAASIPAAAYDSSEHPRNCHPGTHIQYIDQIVNWGSRGPKPGHRIFWLKGPQELEKEFAARNKLSAAFFFSSPNQRDNPQYLFASISYQWASKRKPYAEIVKSTVHDDPTIVDKELRHQFYRLFVSPLQELIARGEDIPKRVIVIGGLDECAGVSAQQTIV